MSSDEVAILQRKLAVAHDKLKSKEREYATLKVAFGKSEIKIAALAIENQVLGHKNRILETQATTADKDLGDTQRELYRVDKEVESLKEEAREAKQETKQARVDVSIALGEVARLNGVASALMKELEEARQGAAERDVQSACKDPTVAQVEIVRLQGEVADLKRSVATYKRLLDAADSELVLAQSDAEELRKKISELEQRAEGPPLDGWWRYAYRSEFRAAVDIDHQSHVEIYEVCRETGNLLKQTGVLTRGPDGIHAEVDRTIAIAQGGVGGERDFPRQQPLRRLSSQTE
ncbi:hypothetical protein NMY22_g9774 [Coprinellus aureogranulatus]|nr:hypothetical protein NMY22_g9774 [Coprinellus aureogranulatus]